MRHLFYAVILAGWIVSALPLAAQEHCTVVINSPEDQLMLAVNGADTPQEQIDALDKYAQAHPTSAFMPCVYESYTAAYLKLNQFDKAVEYGEKDVAANFWDMNMALNLLRGYVGSGKVSDTAFSVIMKMPELINQQGSIARPPKASDADWQKMQQNAASLANEDRAYVEYAFLQLLPRLTDPTQRLTMLDKFLQTYPDLAQKDAGVLNYQYATAYTMANQVEKADEYAEKAIAADPNNVEALNLLAFDYAIQRQTNLGKAAADAKQVIAVVPTQKKPDGMGDDQFQAQQNNELGMAHLSLGFSELIGASHGKRFATHAEMASAIQELKTAGTLLASNPRLQGGALFYLANAYEEEYPAEHHDAIEALTQAIALQSPWQPRAQDLLEKVKKAGGH